MKLQIFTVKFRHNLHLYCEALKAKGLYSVSASKVRNSRHLSIPKSLSERNAIFSSPSMNQFFRQIFCQ